MSSHGDGHNPYTSQDTALRTARAAMNRAMSLEALVQLLLARVEVLEARVVELERSQVPGEGR